MQNIGVGSNSKEHFYMKTPSLRQILQASNRVSTKESKICEISKLTLRPYSDFAPSITQTPVFQQLVPFIC